VYSVAELKDLLANKDAKLSQLAAGLASFDTTWKARDAVTESAWQKDYQALLSRYHSAKVLAEVEIAAAETAPLPDNAIPATTVYDGVLNALQKTSGVVSPGDLQDVWDRLVAAQGAPIPEPTNPQPKPGTDLGLTWYQSLDAFARGIIVPSGDKGGGSLGPYADKAILIAGAAAMGYILLSSHGTTVVIKRERGE
jgi:hypothetical protein